MEKTEESETNELKKAGFLATLGVVVAASGTLALLTGNKTYDTVANNALGIMGISALIFAAQRKAPEIKHYLKQLLRL